MGHAVARDFGIMMTAAALATALLPSLREMRLDETLRQFEAPLREQVDLSREADHLWQFVFNFRDRPDVRFPQPVFPLVSPSVLVETFEEGGPIGDHVAAGPAGRHGAALAAIGSAAVLRMLLCDNLVHADLHPGNILCAWTRRRCCRARSAKGGPAAWPSRSRCARSAALSCACSAPTPPRSWLRPSLVLLDVGMTTSLGPRDRDTMVALFTAFSRGDGRGVAEHAMHFSEACGERQRCPDKESFARAMDLYFRELDRERALAALPGGTPTDGGKALAGVLELIRQHRVSLPVRERKNRPPGFSVCFLSRFSEQREKKRDTHSLSLLSFLSPSLSPPLSPSSPPLSLPPPPPPSKKYPGPHLCRARDDPGPRGMVLEARPLPLADRAGRGAAGPGEEHRVREDGDEVGPGEGEHGPAVRCLVRRRRRGGGEEGRERTGRRRTGGSTEGFRFLLSCSLSLPPMDQRIDIFRGETHNHL